MTTNKLPFDPLNRSSNKGCTPSVPGCILAGSLLAFLAIIILGGAGLTAWFLARPKITAAPSVEITTPANGSEVALNVPVLVGASATASEEISRLELWQGGQQVTGLALTNDQSLAGYEALFQWVPPAPGSYTLEVRAYGPADDLNALAMVAVNVVDTQAAQAVSPVATPTPTPIPEATATIAPTSTPLPTATPVPTNTPIPAPPPAANQPQPGGQPGGGGPPGGPGGQLPQEAIAACSGLSEGSTCTASGPMGEMTGTCVTLEAQLACMPEGGPPGGRP